MQKNADLQKSSNISIPARKVYNEEFEDSETIEVQAFDEDEDNYGQTNNTTESDASASLLWAVLSSYLPTDEKSIQRLFVHRAEYDLALTYSDIKQNPKEQFAALAVSVRDRLIERWKDTELFFDREETKKVYYLSLEFLMGRSLQNALSNLNLNQSFSRALRNLGIKMEELYEEETDAGLGNGGLGRLASCFLDSLATMNYPAWGYGLRYQYGIFHQLIKNGYQVECPDFWLRFGNPWEIERLDVQFPVEFYGRVVEIPDPSADDGVRYKWEGHETVMAVAYDIPIPGFKTYNTINLRLWSSRPSKEFDFQLFDKGNYFAAIENKQRSETITSVLYPNDNTSEGKELRLKQQFFFVSATLQDILKRFKRTEKSLTELHTMVGIQLNDTHPALGIAELMHILVDKERLKWDTAWDITRKIYAYTNHTVLPEALEKWDVRLMENLLPRHLQIIYRINHFFLMEVEKVFPPEQHIDMKRILSLIQEEPSKKVRMAHLAIVGSHHINGVAQIHSDLLKTHVFPEFFKMYPRKFTNVTNGVTPRRWVQQANPSLTKLISETLGTERWLCELELITEIKKHVDNEAFQDKWRQAKMKNKQRLAKYFNDKLGIRVNVDSLFDIQIKRIHEYKRQLLNILYVIYRYKQIKGMSDEERADVVRRVIVFAGKAAPGYYIAKLIIKLINCVAQKINDDPDMEEYLKVIFVPNYTVSLAELLIPASDISQHISTAGMEASGTSNMKFVMNGGLLLGTMDGANIEIAEEIGEENMFIFGTLADKVEDQRARVREGKVKLDPRLQQVVQMLRDGVFGEFPELNQLLDTILHNNDYYLLTVDWADYLSAQEKVDKTYANKKLWTSMSIMSSAGTGKFSSDRSIQDYAKNIWDLEPRARPGPLPVDPAALVTKIGEGKLGSLAAAMSPLDILSPLSNEVALERLSPKDARTMQACSPSSSPFW
eukprot:TRINITY_DN4984_c0_g1_i1.p1 TRINITY_DN4984_c0_g1~~TRINITY_DN4984_c0_g1_i1.p1  ORF type:complete len:948 (-),score=244.61 TRINITY_DN4984_c0_g1_i1:182-3025(-)